MDIYSGLKEARLNIPMEGGTSAELEGIPVEQAVAVVDIPGEEGEEEATKATPPEEEEAIQKALRDYKSKRPPPYEAAGKIQAPHPSGSNVGTFEEAKLAVSMEARTFDAAVDDLVELSHDIYYGVEITKSGPMLEKLICLLLGSGSEKFPAKENKRDKKAAAILAAAVQNNPTALAEIGKLGNIVFSPTCGNELPVPKGNNIIDILKSRLGRETDPATLKSKVAAIGGLMRDQTIQEYLLKSKVMELLLAIFLIKGEQWDSTRARVAQAVTDNFLDEDVGATLGIWPQGQSQQGEYYCGKTGQMLDDACWAHHVVNFLNGAPGTVWAEEFLRALNVQRKKIEEPVKHKEL
ncbi:putative nucleotide exchange factor SIL1 [Calycina marina]|uniref:Nucleotide exchange factor SIL1 n=1 Tax=Calycina marina TaxID=1763456 RepID=A0A9P7Z6G8_9HELO|nr:putative nucleotide exchange factor SIL1 [Calycina marina]